MKPYSDDEVKALRSAGVPVPETIEEAAALLREGEASGEPIDIDCAHQMIDEELLRRHPELRESA